MPKAKGSPKTGGRTKGTPNKASAIIRETIENKLGRTLGEELVNRYMSTADEALGVALLKEMLAYSYPKPKAPLEVTGANGDPLMQPMQSLSHGELVSIVKSIRKDMHGEGKS